MFSSVKLGSCVLLILILLSNVRAIAQQEISPEEAAPYIRSAASPQGIYILFNSAGKFEQDTSLYNSTDHFIIQKAEFSDKELVKKSGKGIVVKPFTSTAQLKALYTESELAELRNLMNFRTQDELMQKLRTDRNPASYPFLYMDVRLQTALGHVWLDENVTFGKMYVYFVYRVDKSGVIMPWGKCVQMAKKENAGLLQYSTTNTGLKTSDSSVAISWATIRTDDSPPAPAVKDSIFIAGYNDEIFVHHGEIMQRLYIVKNGILMPSQLILSNINDSSSQRIVDAEIKTNPGDEIMAWVVTEDPFGNQGKRSDTVLAYAVSYNMAPIITEVKSKNIVDGVMLTWPKLPRKPYITGIHIQRYNSDNLLEDIATLPGTDTSFTDYKLQIGHTYQYEVRALFAKSVSFTQDIPAQATGGYTSFSKPMPPTHLRAEEDGNHIQLEWDGSKVKGLYGYYVYRGYDGTEPTLLAGPVIDATTYSDTSAELSGKSVYTYYVITENLRQDVSLPSEPVHIKPNRKVKVYPPSTVQTYYANGQLNLSWDDARKMDNYIIGYQVQRRTGLQGAYQNIGGVVNFPHAVDSNIERGTIYEYRVASVGSANELSSFSGATQFELPEEKDFSKVSISLRNTQKGVAITWPAIERPAQKQFVLYRRAAGDDKMEVLATLPLASSHFTDESVTEGKSYVYAMALEFEDAGKGPLGTAVSIKYKPAAKPEIIK
jgi:fibronectin type 3 domain-containing protein